MYLCEAKVRISLNNLISKEKHKDIHFGINVFT